MITQKIPLFYSGNVLTQDMLESLKQHTVNTGRFDYLGYSDGILKGCRITTTDSQIIVQKGVLIYGGEVFYLSEDSKIVYEPTNSLKLLVVRVLDHELSRSFDTRKIEFLLINEEEKLKADIEICRYRLQAGAKLRYDYKNFADMNTEFDTVCLCHAKWSAYGGESIAYEILYQFAKAALEQNGLIPEDRMFIGQILNSPGQTLPEECISSYLAGRLSKAVTKHTVHELYQDLAAALRLMGNGRNAAAGKNKREHRLIVD